MALQPMRTTLDGSAARRYDRQLEFARSLSRAMGRRVLRLGDLAQRFCERPQETMTGAELRPLWRAALAGDSLQNVAGAARPSLYVCVPLCAVRCSYCEYFQARPRGRGEIDVYARRLLAGADYMLSPAAPLRLSHAYLGGGTPTLWSARQLARFWDRLSPLARLDVAAENTVECFPPTTTTDKMAALAERGFNRASLGVQTMERGLLLAVGRAGQTEASVRQAVRAVRAAGFRELNIDLLLGLAGDDGTAFLRSFQSTAALEPDAINVSLLMPTAPYVREQFGGDGAAFDAHRAGLLPALARARDWAAPRGWTVTEENLARIADGVEFVRRRRAGVRGAYHCAPGRGGPVVVGLGREAMSSLPGLRSQWTADGDDPARLEHRVWRFGPDDEARLELLNSLHRSGVAERGALRRRLGFDPAERFAAACAQLASLGLGGGDRRAIWLASELGSVERLAAAMFFFDFELLCARMRAQAGPP